jgi:threonine dehydrogenase-like Zn-dependent dehydrogenase
MDTDIFDVLLLIGRPASGKSEIIDFLKRCPADLRRARYHLGMPDVQDDFPMAMDMIAQGRIDVSPILTHCLPFDQVQRGYEMFMNRTDGAIKVVLNHDGV